MNKKVEIDQVERRAPERTWQLANHVAKNNIK